MKQITLSDGHTKALVDDEDYDKVIKKSWNPCKKSKRVNTKIYARSGNIDLQRFIITNVPPGHIVRFKNENSLDCRKENLAVVDKRLGNTFFHNSVAPRKPLTNVLPTTPLDKLPPVKQSLLNDKFIGVCSDSKIVTKLVEGEVKQVTEVMYISKYVDSDNREYVFGKFKTPKEAAIIYNKQVKLLANSLKEEVELNVFE